MQETTPFLSPEQDSINPEIQIAGSNIYELADSYNELLMQKFPADHVPLYESVNPTELVRTTSIYSYPEAYQEYNLPSADLQTRTVEHKVTLDEQRAYINSIRGILAEEATFDVDPSIQHGEEADPYGIAWLGAIGDENWPIAIGTVLEQHDREDHIEAFIFSPKEQAILMEFAAVYARKARKATVDSGSTRFEDIRPKDIMIPAKYRNSLRGQTYAENLLGHIDGTTDGLATTAPSVSRILKPLLSKQEGGDFSDNITEHISRFTNDVELFIHEEVNPRNFGSSNQIPIELALPLGCLDLITQGARERHPTSGEIQVALYEVIKGHVRVAAKLRGEEVPEGILDFWPINEYGIEDKRDIEELVMDIVEGESD